ncbi:MAG TPA: substrate-binding domain-containing protein [Allosphingosinicella sp.]|nr:substrate-binding domain-containing protein [Allosphingosinicella sp.]
MLRILVAIAAFAGAGALAVGTRQRPASTLPEAPLGDGRALLVCADPNNLPFSNRARQGFENKLVEMIAADLGKTVRYTWWAQRRGNVRETLNAGRCDLIPGVASSLEMLATTRPYYRSTYVAVTRADRNLAIDSFDDPRLAGLKIGVQLIGDDGSNTPPAHALTGRGHIGNIRGYTVYGDYSKPAPQRDIVEAVVRGEVDIAFVWGPVAGYFAGQADAALALTPTAPFDGPRLPMVYDVSMGVRKGDSTLKAQLDAALARRRSEIAALLRAYRVPVVRDDGAPSPAQRPG